MAIRRIGQILVDLGFITDEQLEVLLEEKEQHPDVLIGKIAEEMGLVTDEQVAFYRTLLARVRDTEEWKAWLRSGSQTDAFLSGTELADYIAADERWLRGQFAEDGWLVR